MEEGEPYPEEEEVYPEDSEYSDDSDGGLSMNTKISDLT